MALELEKWCCPQAPEHTSGAQMSIPPAMCPRGLRAQAAFLTPARGVRGSLGTPKTLQKYLPLGLALGSPIFPSGCEGKLGVALESLHPIFYSRGERKLGVFISVPVTVSPAEANVAGASIDATTLLLHLALWSQPAASLVSSMTILSLIWISKFL